MCIAICSLSNGYEKASTRYELTHTGSRLRHDALFSVKKSIADIELISDTSERASIFRHLALLYGKNRGGRRNYIYNNIYYNNRE